MREHDPAVTPFGNASQRCILVPTKPKRNSAPDRQRIDPGVLDCVPLSLEADVRLGPKPQHDLDLLFTTLTAIAEVLVQAHVFDGIPTDADAEAKTTSG